MKKIGLIYKVENIKNKKVYIGQTSILKSKKELGASIRFKQHINGALNGSNECPRFYNAIRKYGKGAFKVSVLIFCDRVELNDHEVTYIDIFNSTNDYYGYNITKGGDGHISINDEMRSRISKGLGGDPDMIGISKKYNRKKQHIGYTGHRKEGGIRHEKTFTNGKRSLDECLILAKQYLEDFKNNDIEKYNVKIERKQPKNIYIEKDPTGKEIGYRFQMKYNKKIYCRVYTDESLSMNEKYDNALKQKELFMDMINSFKENKIKVRTLNGYLKKFNINHRKHNLPKNIKAESYNGIITGYRFQIIKNKQVISKAFRDPKKTLEENLALAIKAKEEYFNNCNK